EYIANVVSVTYDLEDGAVWDPETGQWILGQYDYVDFGYYHGIDDPNIIGYKVTIEAEGTGSLFWSIDFENPGDVPPYENPWTADPDASRVALHNAWDPPDSYVHVDGTRFYEYVFSNTGVGDPAYGGFTFNNALSDLIESLATVASGFTWVMGRIECIEGDVR